VSVGYVNVVREVPSEDAVTSQTLFVYNVEDDGSSSISNSGGKSRCRWKSAVEHHQSEGYK
jgi:hypothetical protein